MKRTEARVKRDIPLDREYPRDVRNAPVVSGPEAAFVWYASDFEWHVADLAQYLSTIEGWAKDVLGRVKIPAKMMEHFPSNVQHMIEKRGFSRGRDIEWHAAMILKHVGRLRGNIGALDPGPVANGVAISAVQLGALLREAEIQFGMVVPRVQKGGAQPKKLYAVDAFVRYRLKRNPTLTAKALWESIPRDDDEVMVEGAKLYVDEDDDRSRLRVIEEQDGSWTLTGSIGYEAFRRYVTDAKKITQKSITR